MRVERIGNATLYLGNCLEILPTLPKADAVITDPPYGIGADEAASKNQGKWGWKYHGESSWDRQRPTREAFDLLMASGGEQIIWGGNYFTDYLPPTMQWLIWDKGQREFSLADCEIAWSSQQKASRIFNYPRSAAAQDGKQHPTQKPVALMAWCLSFVPKARLVRDPFMGAGTTGVACAKLGIPFEGVEIDPRYFDIACERITNAQRQESLLDAYDANTRLYEQLSVLP